MRSFLTVLILFSFCMLVVGGCEKASTPGSKTTPAVPKIDQIPTGEAPTKIEEIGPTPKHPPKYTEEFIAQRLAVLVAEPVEKPGFASDLAKFWNTFHASMSGATKREAIRMLDQLMLARREFVLPANRTAIGLNDDSEIFLRTRHHRTEVYAAHDPAKLTEYVMAIANGGDATESMDSIIDLVDLDKDLEFIVAWLQTLPKSFAEIGWSSLMWTFVVNDGKRLDAGLQLLDRIDPSIQKDLLLTHLLPTVLKHDPNAAGVWAKQIFQPGVRQEWIERAAKIVSEAPR